MNYVPIDVADIISDVKQRLNVLAKLVDENGYLDDEDWQRLIFYDERNQLARQQFKETIVGIRRKRLPLSSVGDLPPHARLLATVYTGGELTPELCRGGSRFHERVCDQYGGSFKPPKVLREVSGLKAAVEELKASLHMMNPGVIDNIAIDEVLEQLGRRMPS